MRFTLKLELKKELFPMEYRSVVLSYIKNAVSKCNDGKYYDEFFKETLQKDYCFSVILPKCIFKKEEIELEGNEVKIVVSTEDSKKSGLILFSAFIAQKNKPYPLPNGNFMTLRSISEEKQEEIYNSKVIFKTTLGSSLCVRDHDKATNGDTYYIYSDEKFREKLSVVLSNQLINAGFNKEEANNIKINPIQCKKVVVKHYKRYIDTTTGIFEIQAKKEILQYFYDSGIGSRKSAGFGMIDLVTQDLL